MYCDKILSWIRFACERNHCPELADEVTFRFNKRFKRKAGVFKPKENIIELSSVLWQIMPESERKSLVIHEACHAITYYQYNVCNHGSLWKKAMIRCDEEPTRCYEFDRPPEILNKRNPSVVFQCACNQGCKLGPTQAKRVRQGYIYNCKICSTRIRLTTPVLKKSYEIQ